MIASPMNWHVIARRWCHKNAIATRKGMATGARYLRGGDPLLLVKVRIIVETANGSDQHPRSQWRISSSWLSLLN